jgi:hypothetical protein
MMIRAVVLFFITVTAANASPLGEWWTPGFRGRVAIAPCGDALCGRFAVNQHAP